MTYMELIAAAAFLALLLAGAAGWALWYSIRRTLEQLRWYRRWKGGYWLYYHDSGWIRVKQWQHVRARINRHPWAYSSEWCGCCEDNNGAKLPTQPQ